MKSILDKDFRYTPSAATNLKATFARIRREQKEQRERDQAREAEAAAVVAKRKIKVGP